MQPTKKRNLKVSPALVINTAIEAVLETENGSEPVEHVTANIGGAVIRNQLMEGRQYMVVPMVMITEGVHAGSKGPLYYPKEELSKPSAVMNWNHKPIVVYHPVQNGSAVSACEPTVISRRKVGVVMNTRYEAGKKGQPGRLKAEAWLEVNRLKAVDERVLNALQKKQMVEVSTGLFTDNEQVEGVWNSEKYVSIARDYRADHLAILPDETGACSIADGAGLLRNGQMSHGEIRDTLSQHIKQKKTLPTGLSGTSDAYIRDVYPTFCVYSSGGKMMKQGYKMDKDSGVSLDGSPEEVQSRQTYSKKDGTVINTGAPMKERSDIVDALIENGADWDETDREFLTEVPDGQFAKLCANAGLPDIMGGSPEKVNGGNDNNDQVKDAKKQVAPKKMGSKSGATDNKMKKGKKADEEEPDDQAPADNSAQSQTYEEFIANAPEGMREVLDEAMTSLSTSKNQLIGTITANKNNRFSKEYLKTVPLKQLQAIAALAGPAIRQAPPVFNYSGQGDAFGSQDQETQEEALGIPVMNFAKRDE